MNERYNKLFSLEENLYTEGAPVIIKAGALLKDNETGRFVAQLKLCNISDKLIRLAKVEITCLDSVNRPIGEPLYHEYLDLDVSRGVDFGSKLPIIIPNTSARSFSVRVTEVAYANGDIWNNDNEWTSLPKQSAISMICADKYALRAYKNRFGSTASFGFCEYKDIWLCTCGSHNHHHEENCHKCHASRTDLKSISFENLKIEGMYDAATELSRSEKTNDLEKAIELFEKIQEYKDSAELVNKSRDKLQMLFEKQANTQKKRSKTIKIAAVTLGVIVLLVLFAYFVAYPFIAQANGDYEVIIEMYNIEDYEIPEGTTEIKSHAFYGLDVIKTVKIPDSVTTIGAGAFWGCENLTDITIPANVSEMGEAPFQWCYQLKSINVDENNAHYTSIDGNLYTKDGKTLIQYAIGKDDTSFIAPTGVTSIGDSAFWGDKNLKNVTLSGTTTAIGDYAFTWCENLEVLTLGESVKTVGKSAFSNCNLNKIYIGKNVENIAEDAFNPLGYADIYFEGDEAEWEAIKPLYSTYLVNVYFNQCIIKHELTKIPEKEPTCTENGYNEYMDCNRCDYSTYVEIPSLGHDYVNLYCSRCGLQKPSEGLKYIYNEKTKSYRAVGNGTCTDTTIVIPATYNNLPVTSVGDMGYGGFGSYVETIIISEGITSIDSYAFAHNESNLKTVHVPSSVTYIGYCTFYTCQNLESVIFAENSKCETIRDAFYDCPKLQITIPDSVTSITNSLYNIKRIDVEDGNQHYASIDGNLYSKDETTLVRASKNSSSINISVNVTEILDTSLSGITDIYYEGSESSWENITGAKNISSAVTIHFEQ